MVKDTTPEIDMNVPLYKEVQITFLLNVCKLSNNIDYQIQVTYRYVLFLATSHASTHS